MSEILITKRNEKKLARKELAAELKVTVSCIQAWETGNRKPRPRHLRNLKKVLGLSTDEIFAVLGE